MKEKRHVSRREFMRISAFTTAGAILVACGSPAAAPEAPAAAEATAAPAAEAAVPAGPPGTYKEAPMLADLVAAGQLPPVDQRLPENPLVMETVEGIGNYGGTFRRGFRGVSDRWGPTKHIDRRVAWFDQNLNLRPRMFDSWEVSDDGTVWTFHMRPGMKWSDGEPLTTADVTWWWENYINNAEIFPGGAAGLSGGAWSNADQSLMTVEAVDDYTFTFTYTDPKPLLLLNLTRGWDFIVPGHYLAQFHMDLTDDPAALEAQVAEAGFNSWAEYFTDRNYWYMNPERPVLGGWRAMNPLSEELFIMERNPYFFAVDADGQQLPYVDTINHRLFETPDVFDLRIINGEVDFQGRHVNLANFTLYKENEEAGDYRMMVGTSSGHPAIQLNLTTKNERLREFFNKREVRIAFSLCVDRNAVNELVYDGLMVPRQYSPISASPQAYPKQANAYIDYDVDEANRLLDEAGYAEKNGDGMRVWPGTTEAISFIIEGIEQAGSQLEDFVNELSKYYAAVGITGTYKYVERSLYTEHYEANEIEAGAWPGDRTVVPLAAPIIWTGEQPDRPWCPGWALYRNTGGADPNSEAPPEGHWMWDIWDLWDQVRSEPDPDQQTALFQQILDIWAEELPMVGYLGEGPALIIAKNGVRNYTPGMPVDDPTGDEHLLNTETYFWENPA
ncbi:MAG: ABC transporter substrate-binding protein [Caldilineaceae bacterium]|nr:ABC transporter substrate-binding protein [Caldilineaceae bacterium]